MKIQLSDFSLPRSEYRSYGRLTLWTNALVNALTLVWSILGIPIIPVFTFLGGVLAGIPGVALVFWTVVESLLWLLRTLLSTSSRLWRRAPLLRLPLAVAGVVVSVLGYAYVSLTPGVNAGTKYRKLVLAAMCDAWPLSDLTLDKGERLAETMAEDASAIAYPDIHWRADSVNEREQ